jgi:glutathione S-transferase
MESTYKLYYFAGNWRGAVIRAILSYSGAKWENVHIAFGEQLNNLKSSGSLEYGSLPALEIDGCPNWLSQTLAIETYLAKKFNLLGENDCDLYEILNILSSREDLVKDLAGIAFPNEVQKAKFAEVVSAFKTDKLPKILAAWEKKYQTKKGKYALGDKLTLADLFYAVIFEMLTDLSCTKDHGFGEVIAKDAPGLHAHVEALKKNELATFFKDFYIHGAAF